MTLLCRFPAKLRIAHSALFPQTPIFIRNFAKTLDYTYNEWYYLKDKYFFNKLKKKEVLKNEKTY